MFLCSYFMLLSSTYILAYSTWTISYLIFNIVSEPPSCDYGFPSLQCTKSNLCLPRCFFAMFIFFGFSLLPSKLSCVVMPPLEVALTLQDHCLSQTIVTKPNFIQRIVSTLSNLKVSSSFYLEFERGC